jgi:hypothetical protein
MNNILEIDFHDYTMKRRVVACMKSLVKSSTDVGTSNKHGEASENGEHYKRHVYHDDGQQYKP